MLSYAPLEASLDVWERVDLGDARAKSEKLTSLFIELVDQECGEFAVELASPIDPADRGSQVSLRHPESYAIMRALIGRGVIGDFRAPDMMRFGFTPAVHALRRRVGRGRGPSPHPRHRKMARYRGTPSAQPSPELLGVVDDGVDELCAVQQGRVVVVGARHLDAACTRDGGHLPALLCRDHRV